MAEKLKEAEGMTMIAGRKLNDRFSSNTNKDKKNPFGDEWLEPFSELLSKREKYISEKREWLLKYYSATTLAELSDWHHYYGLHHLPDGNWRFREWLPNATAAQLLGEFNEWEHSTWFELHPCGNGEWEGVFPEKMIQEGQTYQLYVEWKDGSGWRLPSAVQKLKRERQENNNVLFNAVVQDDRNSGFAWRHDDFKRPAFPLIYEGHVGISQVEAKVGTFEEFSSNVLPRIARDGYNCIELMAIAHHPYYASFGYQVSNYFAVTDLFGSPEALKRLVDTAHGLGICVIMDIVHSHSVRNELEGLGNLCGQRTQFFHEGMRGEHPAWNSYCFDYGKPQVLRMLLSNCRFWLEEYHIDGLRFDGVTSMIYRDHGLGRVFSNYQDYFTDNVDDDALAYLCLANELCHSLGKKVWTIAEDVSGMPGMGASVEQGGIGFDYRMSMGVTDYWFKLLDCQDEFWNVGALWYELTNHRIEEKTISYVECHDQALVGGQSFLFRCVGSAMYNAMDIHSQNMVVSRGIALHKLARLVTLMTAGGGYLNFMGNEFGHPEWIDFPRSGNNWSYDHARRRWDLCDNPELRFCRLNAFDQEIIHLAANDRHFFDAPCESVWIDEGRHILVFQRAGMLCACNFHPTHSYADYEIPVDKEEYRLILSTDNPAYDGFGQIQEPQHFQGIINKKGPRQYSIKVYLPARTAIVLK